MNERARRQMEEDFAEEWRDGPAGRLPVYSEEDCAAPSGVLHYHTATEVSMAAQRSFLEAVNTAIEQMTPEELRLAEAQAFAAAYGPQVNLMNWLSDDAHYVDGAAREQMDEIDRIIEGAKEGSG